MNYTLKLEALNNLEKVQGIPGLRISPEGVLSGTIDAVSAARLRLGLQPLKRPAIAVEAYVKDLRPYQAEGVMLMKSIMQQYRGGLLADDMGLGKTRQAIAIARSICREKGRVLIVCPASVRETWAEELSKCGVTSVAIMRPKAGGKKSAAQWAASDKAQFVVTSYDLAPQVMEVAFETNAPMMVIMDEAHLVKGRHTSRSNDIQGIAALAPFRLALTATPQYDRPRDFYKLLKILFGSTFGAAFDFDLTYCAGKQNEHGGIDNKGSSNTEELKHRLSFYMVRREKKDVLTELPPLTRQVMWIDSESKATQWFRTSLTRRKGGDVQSAIEATLDAKMPVAIELAKTAKRFLLFTWMKKHAKQMSDQLNDEGTPNVLITGDMPTEKRNELGKLATAKGWGVVATIDSLSVGVNLQSVAEVGIFHSLDYVPQKMAQAEARLHRMGQKNAVTWYWLAMKDTIDEVIVREVVKKLEMWTETMGKGGSSELRDKLNAAIGVGEHAEKEALAALYASMDDDE